MRFYEMDEQGNERVGFTDVEWEQMMSDPRFGYVCSRGHSIDQAYAANLGGCRRCEELNESEQQ